MIDPDALLQPIPGDSAVGIDLHNDAAGKELLSDLTTAHRAARSAERSLRDRRDIAPPEGEEPPRPDWQLVASLACGLLETHSKDLQVAALLMEASIHTDGFRGLAAGAAVTAGLIERYWNDLYPALLPVAPGDSADWKNDRFSRRLLRLLNLGREGGILAGAVYNIFLFTPAAGRPVALFDAQEAKRWTDLDAKQRADWLKDFGIRRGYRDGNVPRSWSDLCKEATATGATELAATRSDITAALRNWRTLGDTLAAQVGGDRLSTPALSELLVHTLKTVNELLPPTTDEVQETAPPPVVDLGPMEADLAPVPRRPAGGWITNREEALRSLQEVTAFFRRADPVSPLAYALEEIVRRARLTWPELLAEIVPDRQAREMILARLGIQPPTAP